MRVNNLEDVLQKSIFEVTDLNNLSDEEKTEVFEKAYETVMNRILIRIADRLSESELDELKKLIDASDQTKVHNFFEEKSIDIDQISTEETLAYKVEMASITETLKGQRD